MSTLALAGVTLAAFGPASVAGIAATGLLVGTNLLRKRGGRRSGSVDGGGLSRVSEAGSHEAMDVVDGAGGDGHAEAAQGGKRAHHWSAATSLAEGCPLPTLVRRRGHPRGFVGQKRWPTPWRCCVCVMQ